MRLRLLVKLFWFLIFFVCSSIARPYDSGILIQPACRSRAIFRPQPKHMQNLAFWTDSRNNSTTINTRNEFSTCMYWIRLAFRKKVTAWKHAMHTEKREVKIQIDLWFICFLVARWFFTRGSMITALKCLGLAKKSPNDMFQSCRVAALETVWVFFFSLNKNWNVAVATKKKTHHLSHDWAKMFHSTSYIQSQHSLFFWTLFCLHLFTSCRLFIFLLHTRRCCFNITLLNTHQTTHKHP